MSHRQPDGQKDWRGVPIEIGSLVVYGGSVGRSVTLVEATVVGWTKSGRVNVKVIRRSYGGWSEGRKVVHVGHDRLTVVQTLPPATTPTDEERFAQEKADRKERDRVFATHNFPPSHYPTVRPSPGPIHPPCTRCGVKRYGETANTVECPGGP